MIKKNNDEKQNASKSSEENVTNENKSKDELSSKMQSIKNNPELNIDEIQNNNNNSKQSVGIVLGLFLGLIGLIIGLLLYNNENESRQTFIKGWAIGFVVSIVLVFIFASIYFNKINDTINNLYDDYGNIYY